MAKRRWAEETAEQKKKRLAVEASAAGQTMEMYASTQETVEEDQRLAAEKEAARTSGATLDYASTSTDPPSDSTGDDPPGQEPPDTSGGGSASSGGGIAQPSEDDENQGGAITGEDLQEQYDIQVDVTGLADPAPPRETFWVEWYAAHPLAAQEQFLLDVQRAEYQTYVDQKAVVESHNRASYVEHSRAFGQTQAVAYRTSVAHLEDARKQARELSLLSQDFEIAAGQRAQTQVTRLAKSGVLITGSAEERLEMTYKRGAEGAARLEGQANVAKMRGEHLAESTRRAPVKPEFIPQSLPAPVEDPDDPTGEMYKKRANLMREWQRQGYGYWHSARVSKVGGEIVPVGGGTGTGTIGGPTNTVGGGDDDDFSYTSPGLGSTTPPNIGDFGEGLGDDPAV